MNRTKKLFSVAVAATMALTMSAVSNAETVESVIDTCDSIETSNSGAYSDGFVLVSENQYVDENGNTITDRLFVKDDIMPLTKSGTRTYKVTKNVKDAFEMWVQGTFSWDSEKDTATVTNVSSGYEILDTQARVEISDEVTEYKSNQGKEEPFGVGHKYAYIQYELTADVSTWPKSHYSIYTDVNTEGERKIRRCR